MIPATRWRRLAVAVVAVGAVLVALVVGMTSPDLLLVAGPLLLGLTLRSAFAPEGWAPHVLVLTEVAAYVLAIDGTRTGVDWAAAVLVALAVLATHLALSLLAAWPSRAPLPRETAGRTTTAFGLLGMLAVLAGVVGALAGSTPDTWAAWLVPASVLTLAGLLLLLRAPLQRGWRR
jgi:hypothetical protein